MSRGVASRHEPLRWRQKPHTPRNVTSGINRIAAAASSHTAYSYGILRLRLNGNISRRPPFFRREISNNWMSISRAEQGKNSFDFSRKRAVRTPVLAHHHPTQPNRAPVGLILWCFPGCYGATRPEPNGSRRFARMPLGPIFATFQARFLRAPPRSTPPSMANMPRPSRPRRRNICGLLRYRSRVEAARGGTYTAIS